MLLFLCGEGGGINDFLDGQPKKVGSAGMTNLDELIEHYSSRLDPSLVLCIANEEGRSLEDAKNILNELAGAVPSDFVEADPVDTVDMTATSSTETTSKLLFLHQTFPDKEESYLREKLVSCNDDIDATLDEILVDDILSSDPTAFSTARSTGGLDLQALSHGISDKKKKPRKHKNKKNGPVTVSLTDQRSPHHIYYETRMARQPIERPKDIRHVDSTGLNDEEFARQLQNAEREAADAASLPVADQQWLLASSSLSQLAVLLHLPTSRIQSVFNQCSFNLHVTMGRVIELAANSSEALQLTHSPDFPTMCTNLASITGKSERHIQRLLKATKGDQDAVLDLLHLETIVTEAADGLGHRPDILDPSGTLNLEPSSAEVQTSTMSQHKVVSGAAPRWLSSDATSYAGRASQPAAAPNVPAAAAMSTGQALTILPASAGHVTLPTTASEADTDHAYSRDECLAFAAEARARRDAALQQASRNARLSKGSKLGGAAMVYAEEARKHDQVARRWQLRAASALVEQRRVSSSSAYHQSGAERIDLHGLTVHEALNVVAQCVARWQSTPLGENGVRPRMEIVTGRGVHSRHNMSVIRPAIVRFLTQRGLTVDSSTDAGVLYVKSRAART